MKNLDSEIQRIIYWIGLGIALIVYAHANFATSSAVEKIQDKIDDHASKEDIRRLESKIDTIQLYLMENK